MSANWTIAKGVEPDKENLRSGAEETTLHVRRKDNITLLFDGLDRTEITEMTFNSSLCRVDRRITKAMEILRREKL